MALATHLPFTQNTSYLSLPTGGQNKSSCNKIITADTRYVWPHNAHETWATLPKYDNDTELEH